MKAPPRALCFMHGLQWLHGLPLASSSLATRGPSGYTSGNGRAHIMPSIYTCMLLHLHNANRLVLRVGLVLRFRLGVGGQNDRNPIRTDRDERPSRSRPLLAVATFDETRAGGSVVSESRRGAGAGAV